MNAPVHTVVFDVGRVLIEWDVSALLAPLLGGEQAVEAFLIETRFLDWNLSLDGGLTFEQTLPDMRKRFPHHAAIFDAFAADWIKTTPGAIDGSVALLAELKAKGVPVYAITNFSAETWPIACAKYPFLGTSFIDVVVSGQAGVLKPDPTIYATLLERNALDAAGCLFVDDSPKNVAGARAAGMQAIQFTGPHALRVALTQRGIL
ncbi:MAG: HAD family phosphatase [Devosiaceae bacterium]|nr:HAD family phosphatase [Devosiaceae bacterium MH13]